MRRLLLIILLISVLLFTISGCNVSKGITSFSSSSKNQNHLTQKDKSDDFEYMYTILKENYPFFEVNKRVNGIDWLGKKNEYINKIKSTKNDEDFYRTLSLILSELHDGEHTSILNRERYTYFSNLYNQDFPWANQLNDSKAVSRYTKEDDSENSKMSFNSSRNTIGYNSKDTNLANQNNSSENSIESENVKTQILSKANKVAYLKIRSFDNFKMEEDLKIIKPFLNSVKYYTKLIIDIRGNGGGTDAYWEDNIVPKLINKPLSIKYYFAFRGGSFEEEFVKYKLGLGFEELKQINSIKDERLKNIPPELIKDFKYYYKYEKIVSPTDSINFKGDIYLLVDKGVSSSADGFASFAKSTGFATLVGEKTFGQGIGLDPIVCVLPNSGYVFRFPMVMGLASDGTCNDEYKTIPDIQISQVWYKNLFEDRAVQYALKGKIETISVQKVLLLILIIVILLSAIYFKIIFKLRKRKHLNNV